MARRDQVVRRLEIDALRDEILRPSLTHVIAPLYVHARSSTSGRCPCCNSDVAKVDSEIPDLQLLIDSRDGDRYLRHDYDPAAFDDLAADADLKIVNPLRCSELGMRLILSDARITCAQGGSRSSKTQHNGVRSFRQWMLRGGSTVEACFVGPEVRHTHLLLRKWVEGEDGGPPICDPRLVLRHTTIGKHHQEDQSITMIDGTTIHLFHLNGDGANVAGGSMTFIWATELAKVRDKRNWAQVRTRITSSKGTVSADAVPEAVHWIDRAILKPAAKEEDQIRKDAEDGIPPPARRRFFVLQLEGADNPWNTEEEAKEAVEDLEALDPKIAARYGRGESCSDREKTFAPFIDRRRHCFEHEAFDLSHLGLVDVTRSATLFHFPRAADWVIPVDVNGFPHTAMPAKIGVLPEVVRGVHPTQHGQIDRKHWIFVIQDFVQVWGMDSEQAADHLAARHDGKYAGAAVIMDGTACLKGTNAGGQLNTRKKIVPGQAYKRAGFQVRGPDKSKRKDVPANPSRHDSAIVLRRLLREGGPDLEGHTRVMVNLARAEKFVQALLEQESEPDGITPLKWTSQYDEAHVVSATDVARYLVWPFARSDKPDTAGNRTPREHA